MDASWYPLLSKLFKTKLQVAQHKYIRFYLGLPPLDIISPSHFGKVNWLPIERRVELCVSSTIFEYWKGIEPSYLNDMSMTSLNNYNTRSRMELDIPLSRTNKGRKSKSLLGPNIKYQS